MILFNNKIICENKNVLYNYHILNILKVGIVLKGWEVKSVRSNKINISNSYITVINGEAFVVGLHIQPLFNIKYDNLTINNYRKLLLSKKELNFLYGQLHKKGYTIVVLSLFWKRSWCKLKIGIGIGKTNKDKRDIIKKRDWNRYKERIIKRN